jgi:hypothetical protein
MAGTVAERENGARLMGPFPGFKPFWIQSHRDQANVQTDREKANSQMFTGGNERRAILGVR